MRADIVAAVETAARVAAHKFVEESTDETPANEWLADAYERAAEGRPWPWGAKELYVRTVLMAIERVRHHARR